MILSIARIYKTLPIAFSFQYELVSRVQLFNIDKYIVHGKLVQLTNYYILSRNMIYDKGNTLIREGLYFYICQVVSQKKSIYSCLISVIYII